MDPDERPIPTHPEEMARYKYQTDDVFRQLVEYQIEMVQHGYTGVDLGLAAALAQMIAAVRS